MTAFDPFELDLEKVFSRLSFEAYEGVPEKLPPTWRPWEQPKPALPIDRFITDLMERDRQPKLRDREALVGHHQLGTCPFAVARAEVARAALNAAVCYETDQRRKRAITAMKKAVELLKAHRAAMIEIVDQLMTSHEEAEAYGFLPDLAGLRLDEQAHNLSGVLDIQKPLNEVHVRLSHLAAANVWRISFAGALLRGWWVLTDRDPGTSEHDVSYISFLDAGWESLSSDVLPPQNWESAVRTARARARQEHLSETPWRDRYCHFDPALVASMKG